MSINPETLIRPDIATMEPYTPIYPFEVLAARLGRKPEEIIKLDANENPYGPSPKVQEALANLQYAHIYPDPQSTALRARLAEFTGVPADYLLAGLGADELIDLTMRLFIHPFDADVNGAKCVSVPRRADFSLDVDGIEKAVARHCPKLLFVASPNNPDGSWLANADLERLLALPIVVVLDEAYVEFMGMKHSRITMVPQCENLIVLRTFSKLAGLAGIRVGYGAFPAVLMPHLWKIKQPYNVTVAGSAAAIAALEDIDWLEDKVALIVEERERLWKLLGAIPYLRPYPSRSNFILCQVVGRDAHELKLALEGEGILIRYYRTPRLHDHVRFTVGKPEHTDAVIDVLRRI
jgi:histidinol-phosphate aminotransferase